MITVMPQDIQRNGGASPPINMSMLVTAQKQPQAKVIVVFNNRRVAHPCSAAVGSVRRMWVNELLTCWGIRA